MILVTGASGKVGSVLVRELKERNAEFRALVHKPEDAERLQRQGIEAVEGDLGRPGSLRAALKGADHLFLLTPPSPDAYWFSDNVLQEARRTGVRHVVKLSAMGAQRNSGCVFLATHARIEERIEELGFGWTHLRPNMFMQTLLASVAASVKAQGAIVAPAGDAVLSFIDARDVAAVAARVLTDPGHERRVYELTGPQVLGYKDVAERLSAILERKVQYVDEPDAVAYKSMTDAGLPPVQAHNMVALFQAFRRGMGALVSGWVEIVTERPPRKLEDFLRESRQAFLG
jgi:uncharacterized protein YbjT (DUF2867 family)